MEFNTDDRTVTEQHPVGADRFVVIPHPVGVQHQTELGRRYLLVHVEEPIVLEEQLAEAGNLHLYVGQLPKQVLMLHVARVELLGQLHDQGLEEVLQLVPVLHAQEGKLIHRRCDHAVGNAGALQLKSAR